MLEIDDLQVFYGNIRALDGIVAARRPGRARGAHRVERGRQVNDAEDDLGAAQTSPRDRSATRATTSPGSRPIGSWSWASRIARRAVASSAGSPFAKTWCWAVSSAPRPSLAADIDRVIELFPRLRERMGQAGGTLSGGEQQMLAIARALMSRPAPAAAR